MDKFMKFGCLLFVCALAVLAAWLLYMDVPGWALRVGLAALVVLYVGYFSALDTYGKW